MPQRYIGKLPVHPGENHCEIVERQAVGLNPLHKVSTGSEMFANHGEEFVGVQGSDSCDPGIRRFRNNYVIAVAASLQKIARIIVIKVQARVSEHAAIQTFEVRGSL